MYYMGTWTLRAIFLEVLILLVECCGEIRVYWDCIGIVVPRRG